MPDLDILDYFASAKSAGKNPSLLQFEDYDICGIDPVFTLLVKNNRLYKNNVDVGEALEIFRYLKLSPSKNFFPAFIGFFAYEFAKYYNMPVHKQEHALPEAFFCLYERGLILKNKHIIHHDKITMRSRVKQESALASLEPGLKQEEFLRLIELIKNQIREGDVYQVNLSVPFYFEHEQSQMLDLYEAMRMYNPSPFMGMIMGERWSLLSGSPERLFKLKDKNISARPIAGTKKRGFDEEADNKELKELLSCPKEKAEHAMLVDLMRNDLHKIADISGVIIEEDRSVEFYSHVMHLVSNLKAQTSYNLKNIFAALFPGGTITGAPKISVMKSIAELEIAPRGPYTGSLGYISGGHGVDFNILIRSIIQENKQACINAGAGIVIDSDANKEWDEVLRKAHAVKDILQKIKSVRKIRACLKGSSLEREKISQNFFKAKIIFIENFDSFSFNIIAALKNLGADVCIAQEIPSDMQDFTHVVMGPGPGNPSSMPWLEDFMKKVMKSGLPILGICLGHQALGNLFGSHVIKLPEPIHGKSEIITHSGQGLFASLKSPLSFTRYHSLALAHAPENFVVDAYSPDGCIMAIRHKELPIFGLQFHPESYLSEGANILFGNFLKAY